MPNHQKVILFNGPPRSGKDTAVQIAERHLNIHAPYLKPKRVSFAAPLKDTTHKMFSVFENPSYYEDKKDIASQEFFGMTPREAYITVSEKMVKPALGHEHWGRVAVQQMRRLVHSNVFLFSDSGFIEELEPVIHYIGPTNVSIIEIAATRDGTPLTYEGDSRNYIGAEAKKRYPAITVRRIPNDINTEEPNLTMFSVLVQGVLKLALDLKGVD